MARRPSKDGKYRYELVLDPQSDADLVQLLEGNKEHGTSYTITLKACMRGQLMPLIQQGLSSDDSSTSQPVPQPDIVKNAIKTPSASASKPIKKQTASSKLDPSAVARLLNGNDIKKFG